MSIEVSQLTRFFGRAPAVRQLDMSVPGGSVTGLVGPNGAGKTTLLLMLAALMTGIVKLEQVRETAEFLIDAMPLMFIPAGVGLMTAWGQLRQILLPVTIITFVSTVAVMGVTGRVTERLLAVTARGRAKGETAAAELKEELLAEKAVLKAELGELASREAEKVKELVEEAEETVRNSADERKQHTLDKAEEKTSGREETVNHE